MQQRGRLTLENLQQYVGFSKKTLQQQLNILRHRNWMDKGGLHLTEKGQEEARRLVRAHRLWETYLVNEIGLTAEQIHEDAEKYEHLLTDEILDEVDKKLGYPTTDPHGSPIPARRGMPTFSLIQLELNQVGKIAPKQTSEHISSRLWELGLVPDSEVQIKNKQEKTVEVEQRGKQISIPLELARQIHIIK